MGGMEMLSFYESLNLHIAYADILYCEMNNDKSITMWNLEWITQRTVNFSVFLYYVEIKQ